MFCKKGLTLMEIVVVLAIIGILVTISVPVYTTLVTEGAAKAAQNNLITIYNAQRNYYLSPATGGGYYSSGASTDDLTNINTNLVLNITDANFKYSCTTAGPSFSCIATDRSDGALSLTVTSGTPGSPHQIILPGGAGCTASPWSYPSCNPSCTTNVAAFCPS